VSELRLYNTRTRRKEVFTPADPSRVTMYVCGPTVYGRAHIGNARPAVVFDVLARLLRHKYPNHKLEYARNITDIDDKIMAAAAREGVGVDEIASRYEAAYVEDMAALGVAPPTAALSPHATQYVSAMVRMIGDLISRGFAYEARGHVLFDADNDPQYLSLSGNTRENLIRGKRVTRETYAKGELDFVLWKPSTDEQPGWESPWGRGRPGWHIECSAMIRELLGETIDIHGGGQDLIFPHHENEAAQSRCANGAELARVWMHNGFVDFGNTKMSKSVGNVVMVDELLSYRFNPEQIRYALLTSQYRQPLGWSDDHLFDSRASLHRLYSPLRFNTFEDESGPDERIVKALKDDLNTPLALSILHALNAEGASKTKIVSSGKLLGLLEQEPNRYLQYVDDRARKKGALDIDVADRIESRRSAKTARDFATADRIRDELAAEGIVLEDGPAGTTWRRA